MLKGLDLITWRFAEFAQESLVPLLRKVIYANENGTWGMNLFRGSLLKRFTN